MFSNNNIFKYRSLCRKIYKQNKEIIGLVNDHHIIPKSLKNHKLLKITNYKINQNYNLFIMPNSKNTIKILNLHPNTIIHDGSHEKYNFYVKQNLNKILKYQSIDEKKYYLWLFVKYLEDNLKINKENIPWE